MRPLTLLLLGLVACSDYELNPEKEDPAEDTETPVVETGESDPPDSDPPECGDPDLAPGSVGVDETCVVTTVGTFTPVIEWNDPSLGDIYVAPVVASLTDDNGDGNLDELDIPDIVVASAGTGLSVVSGDGSGLHWRATGIMAVAPAVGDLDGDGWPEVVGVTSSEHVAWHGRDGSVYWRSGHNTEINSVNCGGLGIYDLDADGQPEVIVGAAILDGRTGALRGKGTLGSGTGIESRVAAQGVAADLDRDGAQEVVVGNAAYDEVGNTLWTNGESDGYVAIADFDGDPEAEVVVAASPGVVRLQDHDGTVLWRGTFTSGRIGPPTVADFDGDGLPEIGVAGHGVYVVIEDDGRLKWQRTIQDYSSGCTGSSVFDFEGDGKAEVVFADEADVWVFDGETGDVRLQESRHASYTCTEYPVIADVDRDGHAEIVYASYQYGGDTTRGVTVLGDADDSWMPGRDIWNQHAYNITNVEGDGGIPATPDVNWDTFNNFRSGDMTAVSGSPVNDPLPVLVETCDVECDRGFLRVVLQVGNGGTGDLPAGVVLSLYALDGGAWILLGSQATTASIPSGGTSPGMLFELDPALVPEHQLKAVVNEGSSPLPECHDENNVLVITEGLCG